MLAYASDTTVVDVELVPSPRQRLFTLLDGIVAHGACLTFYAEGYSGDLRRDFLSWVATHPQHGLRVSESRVVTDYGWQTLLTASYAGMTSLRVFSIYFPVQWTKTVDAEVLT